MVNMTFDRMRPPSQIFAEMRGYSPVGRMRPEGGVDVSGLPEDERNALNRALLADERIIATRAIEGAFPGTSQDLDSLDDRVIVVQPSVHAGIRGGHFLALGLLKEMSTDG